MVDWKAIETEYITTDISYRKLAQKYGVGASTLYAKGSKEKWVEKKEQYQSKTMAKTLEKTSQQEANRAVKMMSVADKLLLKIEAIVDRPEPLNEKAIRSLTAAVKDLKEIQSIKSALDDQEQKARIAKLQMEAEKDEDTTDVIEVVFTAGPEEWNE